MASGLVGHVRLQVFAHAAINVEHLPVEVAGRIGCEEDGQRRDLFGLAERRIGIKRSSCLRQISSEPRPAVQSIQPVEMQFEVMLRGAELLAEGRAEADHASLGRCVRRESIHAALAEDAVHEDEPSRFAASGSSRTKVRAA